MNDTNTLQGRCLCGKVQYEIKGPLISADHCHCSMCRRQHGAAFSTYAEFETDAFRWVSGEEITHNYEPSDKGGWCFCQECGSTLGGTEDGRVTSITLGTIVGDPDIRPSQHIYVGSKAPWHEIEDSLPQYDQRPPNQS